MKIVVEKPLKVGGAFVTAVVGHEIEASASFGFISLSGRKVPMAVVVRKADGAMLFHMDGQSMTLRDLKRLCKDAPDAMSAITDFVSSPLTIR